MEKSDEYIDYAAYVRFLVKVTEKHPGVPAIRKAVLEKTVEKSEMQMLWIILKKLAFAAAVVIACLLIAGVLEILLK